MKGQRARCSRVLLGKAWGCERWPPAGVTSLSSAHPWLAQGGLWREVPEWGAVGTRQQEPRQEQGFSWAQSWGAAWRVAVLSCGREHNE